MEELSLRPVGPQPVNRLNETAAQELAVLLKALADPVRLRLLAQLVGCDGEVCVCNLDDLGVAQPTVSHHLKKLRDAGLVDCERRGTWVHYWATDAGRRAYGAVSGLLG